MHAAMPHSLLTLGLGCCQFALLRKWFLRYTLGWHSLHDCCCSFSCRCLCWYGTFDFIVFFVWLIILCVLSGCCHESEGTLNTRGDAGRRLRHSYESAVLRLLFLFIFVRVFLFAWYILVFRPSLLHLALFKLFFSHFSGSVFQRKPMHLCLILSHLFDCLLGLLRQLLVIEVRQHRLSRSFNYIYSAFKFLLEVFCSIWQRLHCCLNAFYMLSKDLLDHVFQVWLSLVDSIEYLKRVFSELVFLRRLEVCRLDRVEQVVQKEDVFAEGVSYVERVVHDVIIVQHNVVQQDLQL